MLFHFTYHHCTSILELFTYISYIALIGCGIFGANGCT